MQNENNEYRNHRTKNSNLKSNEKDLANSKWTGLEFFNNIKNLSPKLWSLNFLTTLKLNDINLTRVPAEIGKLTSLQKLDLSSNKLRSLPTEIGDLINLIELYLNNNSLHSLPHELGRLFQIQILGLDGNPLSQEVLSWNAKKNGSAQLISCLLDRSSVCERPEERHWQLLVPDKRRTAENSFIVMCYNVLCDKYCTKSVYGYCPSWALEWEYRKKLIMNEILQHQGDILSLQEVETEQFYNFFLPELQKHGYEGIFSAKSRARTMSEDESKKVDGCAIFFKTTRFTLKKHDMMEFNQLAAANSKDASDMLNRVMTKDNIGIVALLETNDDFGFGQNSDRTKRLLMVSNVHMAWEPEYSDVKLIQTVLLMQFLQKFREEVDNISILPGKNGTLGRSIPLVMCGDLNSLPDSGPVEFLDKGRISTDHEDFQSLDYGGFLSRLSITRKGEMCAELTHAFQLKRTYESLEYSNYTFHFRGVIDWVYYSYNALMPIAELASVDQEYLKRNKLIGWPHPHFPSDHQSLLVEFEFVDKTINQNGDYANPQWMQQRQPQPWIIISSMYHVVGIFPLLRQKVLSTDQELC
ncbi:CCR4-NOT transcription complex subunit 6-like isoform X2 [Xenia sp. Carnegie-2017]|uniref:CCR4-NOT transcription complex subunit 6-like isoform X2 n=1 Tax=Xenia sp. Carnegie-2017 TaxID=2897299 RepID=UPI001F04CBAC|nr:CCR4-NOT transcription complex subunit 6-like isoform X2 [Xenia sp. Carnegie-2017]